MNFNNMYRVFVKPEGSKRFKAVAETDDGIVIAPQNKMYHSFFQEDDAQDLAQELEQAGFETKITK